MSDQERRDKEKTEAGLVRLIDDGFSSNPQDVRPVEAIVLVVVKHNLEEKFGNSEGSLRTGTEAV